MPSLAAALPLASAAGLMSGISFAVLVLLFGNLLRRSRLQQPNSVPADGGDLLVGEDTDTKAAGRKREGTRGGCCAAPIRGQRSAGGSKALLQ
mgnify:CR=1 FL=1